MQLPGIQLPKVEKRATSFRTSTDVRILSLSPTETFVSISKRGQVTLAGLPVVPLPARLISLDDARERYTYIHTCFEYEVSTVFGEDGCHVCISALPSRASVAH